MIATIQTCEVFIHGIVITTKKDHFKQTDSLSSGLVGGITNKEGDSMGLNDKKNH